MNIDQEVVSVLEAARQSGSRIRVFYGDVATGRDWHEEWNTMGYVGRSMGTQKVYILLNNSRSLGGGAILTSNIVRITIDKRDVYRHPTYHTGVFGIVHHRNHPHVGAASVEIDGELYANGFKTANDAERFVQFMKGERNAK